MNTFWKPNTQPELYHHGVKGMKWGKHLSGSKTSFNGGSVGGGSEETDILEKLKELYGDKAYEQYQKWRGEVRGAQQAYVATRTETGADSFSTHFSKANLEVAKGYLSKAEKAYKKTPRAKVERAASKGRKIVETAKSRFSKRKKKRK